MEIAKDCAEQLSRVHVLRSSKLCDTHDKKGIRMFSFKCKMCGGNVCYQQGSPKIGVCENCGTQQTIPRMDNDRIANLYDRAGHFRRNNDYDKALALYEQILNEDKTDAEAYWSIILCKYGIEYVEDPKTKNRIPTVNRTQYNSIFVDEDYKEALHYADSDQRVLYEKDAKTIDDIQRGILDISSKEEPFDVFLCYKETDNQGRRTIDSVLANEIYVCLTQEGYKVFFARITLESVLGSAYEPYIFAALNTSSVMVVIGTKEEYFASPWVKNEWSRFLSLASKDKSKRLIPAYRDMDPYDIPQEFSHLQALDMGRLGFMQDLLSAIRKSIKTSAQVESHTFYGKIDEKEIQSQILYSGFENRTGTANLLRRAEVFREDGEFKRADQYYDRVLAEDDHCGQAYLGKIMVSIGARDEVELMNSVTPISDSPFLEKAMKYGNSEIVVLLQRSLDERARKEKLRRQDAFIEQATRGIGEALSQLETEPDEEDSRKSIEWLKTTRVTLGTMQDYKNVPKQIAICDRALEMYDEYLHGLRYNSAMNLMYKDTVPCYKKAAEIFESLQSWKDSSKRAEESRSRATNIPITMKKRAKVEYVIVTIVLLFISAAVLSSIGNAKEPKLFWITMGACDVFTFAFVVMKNKERFWRRAQGAETDGWKALRGVFLALAVFAWVILLMALGANSAYQEI